MYDFRGEVLKMKEDLKEIEEQQRSLAMEFVSTLKLQNKRMFILCLVIFIAFCSLLGYTIWLINDIETVTTETIQEITDVQSIENSTIRNGD